MVEKNDISIGNFLEILEKFEGNQWQVFPNFANFFEFLEDEVNTLKRFKSFADEGALQRWGFKFCPAKEILQALQRETKSQANCNRVAGGENEHGISRGKFWQLHFNQDIYHF